MRYSDQVPGLRAEVKHRCANSTPHAQSTPQSSCPSSERPREQAARALASQCPRDARAAPSEGTSQVPRRSAAAHAFSEEGQG